MIARKETRPERTDVIGFYEITKTLNETQTEIIETETLIRETTLIQLNEEMANIDKSIADLQTTKDKIQQMIDLGEGIEND